MSARFRIGRLDGRRLLIITEAADDDGERAATCLLTPEEY
jgi:hypothetical protein